MKALALGVMDKIRMSTREHTSPMFCTLSQRGETERVWTGSIRDSG